jgi:alkanesulfonate monooxygenase SsuD/methylene tetrahydromethanopterin reductase-like flavin-dependent oxidoreductase (luciferase family)
MQFGVYSFGDLTTDPVTGTCLSAADRLAEVLAQAKLADDAGLEVFAVGEHHRLDFAISATTTVLAAIAARTGRIRLASAVTILGTSDPVRVFEEYATIDLLSGGRAEIIAGRGVYTESFPLFGYELDDQDALYAEHLALLLQLNAEPRVTWSGRFRPPLADAEIAPRPHRPIPIWIGTGGTPASAERAGRLGLPLSLGNITLPPEKIAPAVDAYRAAGKAAGHGANLRVGVAKHVYLARDSKQARDEFFPRYAGYIRSHSTSQYKSVEITREVFEERAAPGGALYVGSPQEIVDKIGRERELFGHDRLIGQIDIGGLPFAKVAGAIELLATEVAPKIDRR